jgi:hypothetical protein
MPTIYPVSIIVASNIVFRGIFSPFICWLKYIV